MIEEFTPFKCDRHGWFSYYNSCRACLCERKEPTMSKEKSEASKVLYKNAVDTWGEYAQLDMVQEECAELIQAVSKIKRQGQVQIKTALHDNLAREIADVRIMCAQAEYIFGLEDHVNYEIEAKLLRLSQRLKKRMEAVNATTKR